MSNAEALEILEKVDTLIVDKTGTLTLGKPKLTELIPEKGVKDTELLQGGSQSRKGKRASSHRSHPRGGQVQSKLNYPIADHPGATLREARLQSSFRTALS
jgi:magnesium-transporting ATPase (P-type)